MKKTDFSSNWGVIGHEAVIHFLQQSFLHQHVSHAYLLVGPPQVGKERIAQGLTAVLLCQQPVEAEACGACTSCTALAAGVHPDVMTITRLIDAKTGQPKKNISIDQVRQLKERLAQSTFSSGRWKVAIVTDADTLSEEASNALLKVLEEPTAHTTLMLLANQPDAVPTTIRSRCQCLPCTEVPRQTLVAVLRQRGIDHSLSQELAAVAGGCPGVALKYLADPAAYAAYQVEARLLLELVQRRAGERLQFVAELHHNLADDDRPADRWAERLWVWTGVLRDALLLALGVADGQRNDWLKNDPRLATLYQPGISAITPCLQAAYRCQARLRQNANVQLTLEDFALSLP